jgi:hypothetical protein
MHTKDKDVFKGCLDLKDEANKELDQLEFQTATNTYVAALTRLEGAGWKP